MPICGFHFCNDNMAVKQLPQTVRNSPMLKNIHSIYNTKRYTLKACFSFVLLSFGWVSWMCCVFLVGEWNLMFFFSVPPKFRFPWTVKRNQIIKYVRATTQQFSQQRQNVSKAYRIGLFARQLTTDFTIQQKPTHKCKRHRHTHTAAPTRWAWCCCCDCFECVYQNHCCWTLSFTVYVCWFNGAFCWFH